MCVRVLGGEGGGGGGGFHMFGVLFMQIPCS